MTLLLLFAQEAATLTQAAYRWRNDDGDEATATWAAAENAGHTVVPETVRRLRVLVNATGNPDAAAFRLEWRKVGDTEWSVLA